MSKFDELDNYITPFGDSEQGDFWYDFASEHARKLLGQFSSEDYVELREALKHKSDEWIIRVCEILEDGPQNQVIEVLIPLLDHKNVKVVLASLDGIRSILQSGFDFTGYIVKIEEAIDRVSPKVGSVWGIALSDLQRILKGEPPKKNWKG